MAGIVVVSREGLAHPHAAGATPLQDQSPCDEQHMTPLQVARPQKRTTQPTLGYFLIRLFDSLVNVLSRGGQTF